MVSSPLDELLLLNQCLFHGFIEPDDDDDDVAARVGPLPLLLPVVAIASTGKVSFSFDFRFACEGIPAEVERPMFSFDPKSTNSAARYHFLLRVYRSQPS